MENLGKCRTCGKDVATTATKCPHCGQRFPAKNNVTAGCLLFFIILVVIGFFVENPSKQPENYSTEYKMAVLNADGDTIQEGDATVSRFRYLLQEISERTGEDQERIADMTVFGKKELKEKYGKEVKLLDFMEGCKNVISGTTEKIGYATVVTMMVTILSQ